MNTIVIQRGREKEGEGWKEVGVSFPSSSCPVHPLLLPHPPTYAGKEAWEKSQPWTDGGGDGLGFSAVLPPSSPAHVS